jgi:predicted N-formylglutamate amidohydrolase
MVALSALVEQVKALLQPLNPFSSEPFVPMSASAALKLADPALEPCPVESIYGAVESGVLILCDHASNAVPPDLDALGLPELEFQRHIAYDIGAAAVTRSLARRLGAPAILTRFSRLIIDPNRGRDDPTLVMRLSDGAVVPGNAHVDDAEIASRIERFYDPYDAASRLGSVMP